MRLWKCLTTSCCGKGENYVIITSISIEVICGHLFNMSIALKWITNDNNTELLWLWSHVCQLDHTIEPGSTIAWDNTDFQY